MFMIRLKKQEKKFSQILCKSHWQLDVHQLSVVEVVVVFVGVVEDVAGVRIENYS
jgi:hypothetical protein